MRLSRLVLAALLALVGASPIGSPAITAAAASRPSTMPGAASVATSDTAVESFLASLDEAVAPDVRHRSGTWTTTDGPRAVHLVEVTPENPGIQLETSVALGGVSDLETMSAQAHRNSRDGHRVVAAFNGDVWVTDLTSGELAPAGILVHQGELVSATSGSRPTFGLDDDEVPHIGDVTVATSLTLADGTTTIAVDRVNKPRRVDEVTLFTRRWGAGTRTPSGGVEVVLTATDLPLRPSGTWTATVTTVRSGMGDAPIAPGTVVVSADGAGEAALGQLTVGTTVTVGTVVTAGWESVQEALGGREWLLHDGATQIRPASASVDQMHPRTAVGVTADGHVILAAIDGRQPGYSIGITLPDLATLLHDAGAVEAVNLDGGGSTAALARSPGDVEASLLNRPSDGGERSVEDGLLVVSTIPTGPLATVAIQPDDPTAVVGSSISFVARGQDAALNGIPVPRSSVSWSLEGTAGTLTSDGSFRARSAGVASVQAALGSVAGVSAVTVVPDTMGPVASAPIARPIALGIVSPTSIPFSISWAAATDVGTGVARYELRRKIDGGAWTTVALARPTSRSVSQGLRPGHSAQYEVRATDRAGNVGSWRAAAAFRARLVAETSSAVRFSAGWPTRYASSFLGGRDRSAATAGRTATFTFSGSQMAWIAPRSATRGSARVSVDGVLVATVSLYRSTSQSRRIVFRRAWPAVGTHTVSIRVLGTARHPRIDVDGFVIVDSPLPDPILVGAGDIASCGVTGDSATAKVVDGIAGTVFTAGDNAYESGTAAEFANCYNPTWGRFKSRTRPVPGNHDYVTAGAAPYYAYFGSRAGTPGKGWYAYDLGAWRIYSLNSNCASIGGCQAGSAQEQWLRADLAANPRACVAAIWHHPLFSSGIHGNDPMTRDLWQALQDAGADLVINGHDHDYERFAPQDADGSANALGIREFVIGTGGAELRSLGTIRANSEVRRTGTFGALKLSLRPTGYAWRFVPVAGATWSDSGSAGCH